MKNILITGTAQGIGNHLAKSFAKANFNVIAIDKDEGSFSEENINFFKVNLLNLEEISALFAKIKRDFGALHILINNAAISSFEKNISNCTEADFDLVISTNLKAMYFCSKEFSLANKGEPYGRIINIASTRFAQNEPNWDLYSASKGAVVSLTNSLSISLAETAITVNAISAGWIECKNYAGLSEKEHQQHPSGRVGKPSDISSYCLFLAQEGNDFINGSNLFIDGGMSKKMIYPSDL